ncbi:hypothetical protein GCM10027430_31320 [Lysobacter tyrosinilyticus]
MGGVPYYVHEKSPYQEDFDTTLPRGRRCTERDNAVRDTDSLVRRYIERHPGAALLSEHAAPAPPPCVGKDPACQTTCTRGFRWFPKTAAIS